MAERFHRVGAADRPYDPAVLAAKPEVPLEGFAALDLRVGQVLSAAPLPGAREPATALELDLGPVLGVRRSSAKLPGYPPESLVGRQVVVAVNLGSRRIAGFVSEVLVLGGLEPDGAVRLLTVDGELAPGSVVS